MPSQPFQVHLPSRRGSDQADDTLPAGWQLRQASVRELEGLALLHREVMPDDLLPSLGHVLLIRHFWPRLLSSAQADVWVLLDAAGTLAGFCVMAHQRMALRLGFYADAAFCWQMLWRLLGRPLRLWQGVVTLLAPRRLRASLDGVPAELVLLVVRPGCQGQGLGQAVLQHALRQLGSVACLVKTASPAARAFYQRAGFSDWGREARDVRPLHLLVHGQPSSVG